ncbi:MAG: ABC transporter ATP-binding protein [Chloroflexota bacterium]|nr:ABC transporter ATP-binding protein [Chloroflexota bacterium]
MSIELRNITKRFGDVVALNNVNLIVDEGEFVTLLGPSGCGKTTLLRIVGGFIEPDEGEVYLNDRLVNHLPPNQRPTGMVFQSYALFPHMTVEKNISFGLRMHKKPKHKIKDKVHEVAALVGIEEMLDRFPRQLSGGQQQRVAIARTLAIEPQALLLDEPLAALDRKLRVGMRTELRKLVLEVGVTTLFVTHDQEEALTMSDHIAVMDKSRIVQFGPPIEVYDKPKSTFVASFIGNSNLFQGVLEEEDGQLVFKAEGLRMPFPESFKNQKNEKVNLLLRPEHLKIILLEEKTDSSMKLGVQGEVTFVTLLGLSTEYEVKLSTGASITVEESRSRDQEPITVGSKVWASPIDDESYLTIPS